MNRTLFLLGTLMCASVNLCAQSEGDLVTDNAHGVTYKVTKSVKETSKKDNGTTVALKNAYEHSFDLFDRLLFSYDNVAEVTTNTNYTVTEKTKTEVATDNVTSNSPVITSFAATGKTVKDESSTTQTVKVSDKNLTKYKAAAKHLIELNFSEKYGWADIYFITYGDLKKRYDNSGIFLKKIFNDIKWDDHAQNKSDLKSYSRAEFEKRFKKDADDICLLVIEGSFNYYPYVVAEITDINTVTTTTNYSTQATPKSISADTKWNNATSVTIGNTVESIADGAFEASSIKTFNVSDNTRFATEENGSMLYNANKTRLYTIGADFEEGVFALIESTKAIANKALSNVKNVTLVSFDNTIVYNENALGGNNNQVVTVGNGELDFMPAPSLMAAENPYTTLSSRGYASVGTIAGYEKVVYAENFNKMLKEIAAADYAPGITYIDLTYSLIPRNRSLGNIKLPEAINSNCLIYLPEGTKASGKNVVIGNKCKELELVRNSANAFANIREFTAEKVTMTQVPLSVNYVTYCFPFEMTGNITLINTENGDSKEGKVTDLLRVCEFTDYDDEEKVLNFTINANGGILANTPIMMNTKDEITYNSFSANNVNVIVTEGEDLLTETNNGWFMGGTYQAVTTSYDGYTFYGMSENKMKKVGASSSFKPFSGYMGCSDPAKQLSTAKVRAVEDEQANDIEEMEAIAEVSVNTSCGAITINADNANVVVVSINGSSIFNGTVSGTETFNVNAGVYIVNGKKYIVK